MTNQSQKVSASELKQLALDTNAKVDALTGYLHSFVSAGDNAVPEEPAKVAKEKKKFRFGGLLAVVLFLANAALVAGNFFPEILARIYLTSQYTLYAAVIITSFLMITVIVSKSNRWLKAICSIGCMAPILLLII